MDTDSQSCLRLCPGHINTNITCWEYHLLGFGWPVGGGGPRTYKYEYHLLGFGWPVGGGGGPGHINTNITCLGFGWPVGGGGQDI